MLGAGKLGWCPPSKKALDALHEDIEGGTRVALAKVSRGEAANEAVNADAAHSLIAQAKAAVGIASHDKAPLLDDLSGLIVKI